MNKPIETYTFSRALHLMRYGGKKMQSLNSNIIYYVNDDTIYWIDGKTWGNVYKLSSEEIMGEFVEVK